MIPIQNPDLAIQEIDGQTIILNRAQGHIHELNETASFIWSLCDGRTPVSEIVSAIENRFSTDRNVVENDVANILEQLSSLGLIRWTEAPK